MAPGVDTDVFLACCLRHCKEKPQFDFQRVAHELGMSVGGVQNKFRDVMRRLHSGGAGKTPTTLKEDKTQSKVKDASAKTTNKRKAPNTKKEKTRSTSNLDDTVVEVQDGEGVSESELTRKKRKTSTKSKKSAAKVEDRDSYLDMGQVEKTLAKEHVKEPAATKVDTKKASDSDHDREESSENETPVEEVTSAKLDLRKVAGPSIKVKKFVAAATTNDKGDEIEEESGCEDKERSTNKPGTTKPESRARKCNKAATEGEKEESDADTEVPKHKSASMVKPAHSQTASNGSTNDHRVEVNIPSQPFAQSPKSEKLPKSSVKSNLEGETGNREALIEADEGEIAEMEDDDETTEDVV